MTTVVLPLEDLEVSLRQNLNNPSEAYWDDIKAKTGIALAEAIETRDELHANRAWFLNKVAEVRGLFVKCFNDILSSACYKAWCDLERIEIALPWLTQNQFYDPAAFAVATLQMQVAQWQSLFPYKVFISPGMIHKRKECSICRSVIDPWTQCDHKVGRVYGGRECYRIVTQCEFLEISLVLDPVQKYSVAFATDGDGNRTDNFDYSIVKFLAERLNSPFDGWKVRWTEAYHPHTMFPDTRPDGACPCESGRAYKACCLRRQGVIRPHAQFEFEKEPSQSLSQAMFAGYGTRNGPAYPKVEQSERETKP